MDRGGCWRRVIGAAPLNHVLPIALVKGDDDNGRSRRNESACLVCPPDKGRAGCERRGIHDEVRCRTGSWNSRRCRLCHRLRQRMES